MPFNLAIEFIGLSLVATLSILTPNLFNIKNLDSHTQQQSRQIIIAAPIAAYSIFRIGFGIIGYISSKLPKYANIRSIMAALLNLTAISSPFYFPIVRTMTSNAVKFITADVPPSLVETATTEVFKALEFGQRVGLLILAWFLLLFAAELIVRIIMGVLALTLWALSPRKKDEVTTDTSASVDGSAKASVEEDDEGIKIVLDMNQTKHDG